jgi:hypothetical protein
VILAIYEENPRSLKEPHATFRGFSPRSTRGNGHRLGGSLQVPCVFREIFATGLPPGGLIFRLNAIDSKPPLKNDGHEWIFFRKGEPMSNQRDVLRSRIGHTDALILVEIRYTASIPVHDRQLD